MNEHIEQRNIVIVGGGFAGIELARRLERRLPACWQTTLLSQDNFVTYNPLLPEVVGASVLPGHVVAPLRQMVKRARVRMVTVSEIDLADKTVSYLGEGAGVMHYDQLVLACGQQANLARYALPLKTLGDALFLRNRVVSRLEHAELQPNAELRRWLLTFVVIGGGFSGVEVAGELVDFLRASIRFYPNIRMEDIKVVLVHGTDRLLPELTASLSDYALRQMQMDGLDIRLHARVVNIDDGGVELGDGMRIRAGTVVCTIGTKANALLNDIGLPMERGRIATAADMSVPQFPGVWAIGDCAAVPNAYDQRTAPPTAQFAVRQARQVAANICAKLRDEPTKPFSYRPMGQLSSVGHNRAVAELFGLRVSGFVAWLIWRGVYLLKVPTLARKVRLFLEWNWAMFFPPDLSHFSYRLTPRHVTAASAAGRAVAKTAAHSGATAR
jgi:NADH:quinone reductase (non-electrogenic)